MIGSLGVPELIVIFVVALIVFGPKKLPELGKSLGKSIAEFKRASNELKNTLEEEIRLDDRRQQAPAAPAPVPSQSALSPDAPPAVIPALPASPAPSVPPAETVPRNLNG
jgi:sec-independent protein translocase protein TatA